MNKVILFICVFAISFIVIGEFDFRYMPHEKRLEYEVDDNLLWRLKPNQNGFEWLAQMSQKSPAIRINNIGFRGNDIDLEQTTGQRILAVGSSSTLGTGVGDAQVWHHLLQDKLNASGTNVTIFNGANPGWGPFQHATFIEQQFSKIRPNIIVVFASVGDLNFKPFETEQEKHSYLEESKKRKELLAISPFATYSLRKAESFIKPVLNRIQSFFKQSNVTPVNSKDKHNTFARHLAHSQYWEEMITFANVNNTPLVFFVPNLENNPANVSLHEHLIDLSNRAPTVKVAYLGVEKSEIPQLQNTYLIANDGHPNALYHAQIANSLMDYLEHNFGSTALS